MEHVPTQQNGFEPATPSRTSYTPWLILGLFSFVILSAIGYFLLRTKQPVPQESPSPAPQTMNSPTPLAQETQVVPTPIDSANWKSYTDPQLQMTLKYPPSYGIEYVQGQPYMNRVVTWHTSDKLITEQLGDHPKVLEKNDIIIPKPGTTYFLLEFGSETGNIPHEEVWFQIPNPRAQGSKNAYLTVRLSAIPILPTPEEIKQYTEGNKIWKITAEQSEEFNLMVSTLRFE